MLKLLQILAFVSLFAIILLRIGPHKIHLSNFFDLIFRPETFIELSVTDAMERNCENDPNFKERCSKDEKYVKQRTLELRVQFLKSTEKLRLSMWEAFLTVFLTLVCAGLLAFGVPGSLLPKALIAGLQMLSAFLILFALVGKLGYPIQTLAGETLPEMMDNYCYILTNIGGMFLLFFTQFYSFKK